MAVEQVEHDLAVRVRGSSVHDVAAGNADCLRVHVGPVLPAERVAFLGQVEGVKDVGIGRDDVHGGTDYQWLALVTAEDTGREAPGGAQVLRVGGGDLGEAAEPGGRVVPA